MRRYEYFILEYMNSFSLDPGCDQDLCQVSSPVDNSFVVDINCDMGESFGVWQLVDDAALMPYISSANIACGFHAGDPRTMVTTVQLAVQHGVAIGAHVSYADVRGFGRRFIEVAYVDLVADILYQLGALEAIARSEGGEISYVKPHGALYNAIMHHKVHAQATIDAIKRFRPGLAVMGMPGSCLVDIARSEDVPVRLEAFGDRNYTAEGSLVARSNSRAVITDPVEVARRISSIVMRGEVETMEGTLIAMTADSVCIHSDTPGAVQMLPVVYELLRERNIYVQGKS